VSATAEAAAAVSAAVPAGPAGMARPAMVIKMMVR
jgi:hypothetical protein